jgi:2-haloacid dehalogenase
VNAATGPSLRRAGIDTLFLDVFGTVVDWRTSIIDESRSFGDTLGITGVDWAVFADRWRALYQPSMNRVRRGERPWTSLDVLHRESLDTVIDEFGMGLVEADALDSLNEAWHRPAPWPDSKPGLDRLHTKYRIATCSNGSVRLLSDLARFGDLPFDIILGPPIARAYKPLPEAYLVGVELLGHELADRLGC